MTHAPTEHPAVPEDSTLKKAIYKRIWHWLLGITLLILLIATLSGGRNDPSGASVSGDATANTANSADTPTGPTFPGRQQRDTVTEAWQTITIENVKITATPLYDGRAVDSTPVVCSTVTVVNTGGSAVSFNGGLDWKLQDPDGVARDTTSGGTDTLLGSGELAPSSAVARDVCFDNTAGAPGQYALIYTPAFALSGDRAVWLSTR